MQIIIGLDSNLIQDQINQSVTSFKHDNVIKIVFDKNYDEILDKIFQASIFETSKNLFLIQDAKFLVEKNDKNTVFIEKLLASNNNIICCYQSKKTDQLFYSFSDKAQVFICNSFYEKDKLKLCKELIDQYQVSFENDLVQKTLIDALPLNPIFIRNEFIKLSTFANGSIVTKKTADLLMKNYSEFNIFQLLEDKLKNDGFSAIKTLDRMFQNKFDPIEIIMIIANQLFKFKLYQIARYSHLTNQTIFQKLAIPIFVQKKWDLLLSKLSSKSINEYLKELLRIDYNIKHDGYDPYFSLKMFFLK